MCFGQREPPHRRLGWILLLSMILLVLLPIIITIVLCVCQCAHPFLVKKDESPNHCRHFVDWANKKKVHSSFSFLCFERPCVTVRFRDSPYIHCYFGRLASRQMPPFVPQPKRLPPVMPTWSLPVVPKRFRMFPFDFPGRFVKNSFLFQKP